MIIPVKFYAQCDPAFQREVLDKLEQKIPYILEISDKEFTREIARLIKAVLYKFADQYLIPEEYWQICLTYLFRAPGALFTKDMRSEVQHNVQNHFFYANIGDTSLRNRNHPGFYLMNANHRDYDADCSDHTVHDFPNDYIDESFAEYERNVITHHPSNEVIKKYQRMKKLYSEIKAAEDDSEKWFNLLLEAKHEQFLRSNVEYRLGKNLLDKQLWKLYIGYLKSADPKAMLVVYSKYIRFFLGDKAMLEEYQLQMKEHGPVRLSWKNLRDFETQSQMLDDMKNAVEEGNMNVTVAETPFNRQICAAFLNNVKPQVAFSLPKPSVYYVFDNAPPSTLQKLFKCRKYFFAEQLTPICYRLEVHDAATVFNDECVKLNILDKNLLEKTCITTTLKIEFHPNGPLPEAFNASNLISLLSQCDAKYIKLNHQKLSYKELKFLIGSKNCVELELRWCKIKDEHGDYVELEKIMEFLPKIKKLDLPTVKVNSNTAHALSALQFEGDISEFYIAKMVGVPFDAKEFENFIIAKRANSIYCEFLFDASFDADFVATFYKILNQHEIW